MSIIKKTGSVVLALLMVFAAWFALGADTAEASQYYYFKTPKANASYTAGQKVKISFYAGVEKKETKMDAWGNPESTTYFDMPVTLKVFKGNKELYSKEYTYQRARSFEVTYIPKTTGTLTLRLYGQPMDLRSTAQELQDTRTIKVKKAKPAAVKKIKPAITVERTAKNKAVITCSNDAGYTMEVWRADKKKGNYKKIGTSKKGTYTDKKLSSAKKEYFYKVRLTAKSGKKTFRSKYSKIVKVNKYTASQDTSALKVVTANTSGGVKISWKAYSGAGYYLVSRGTNSSGDGEVITCNGSNELSFIDKEAVKGKTYYYTVSAWYGNEDKPRVKSKPVKITVK